MKKSRMIATLKFVVIGLISSVVSLCKTAEAVSADEKQISPNILFILCDDLRWDVFSFMNHPIVKTPNIDKLANNGAVFTNCFVTTSLCSPSRASFLTGQYIHTHKVVFNDEKQELYDTALTFPKLLQKSGYKTAYIGKWHMAGTNKPRPGFDYWISFVGQGKYESNKYNENGAEFVKDGYVTDVLTDYTLNWLNNMPKEEKPFCMILGHKAVHEPFTPAERHKDVYKDSKLIEPKNRSDDLSQKPECQRGHIIRGALLKEFIKRKNVPIPSKIESKEWNPDQKSSVRDYYSCLLGIDESVGKIVEVLKTKNLFDNTIIIFAGDNGYFWGEHHLGDKRWAYEESIRIPFIVHCPKLVKPRIKIEDIVLNIDLAPTILDYAGVSIPSTIQGMSFKPLIEDRKISWRTAFLYEYFQERIYPGIPTILGVRTKDWKYVTYPELKDIDELYDLKTDPHELNNLAVNPEYKTKLDEMKQKFEQMKQETNYVKPNEAELPKREIVNMPAELVLHYDFENVEGEKVWDTTKNQNNGKIINGNIVSGGILGRCINLNGNGFVGIPNTPSLDITKKPVSVSIWIKPNKPDGIIFARGGLSNGYELFLENGKLNFISRVSSEYNIVKSKSVVGNKWLNVTTVITGDYYMKLYIDSVLEGYIEISDLISVNPSDAMELGDDRGSIVGMYKSKPIMFTGLIDELKIYKGELNEEQIKKECETTTKGTE